MAAPFEMPLPPSRDSSSSPLEKTSVVFASDARFFEGLAVAVSSALMSHSGPGLRLWVIDGGLAPKQKYRLQSIVRRFGPSSDLRFLLLADLSTADAPLPSVRPLAYARLWIDLALPGCDRAVYIDSDILVRRDVAGILSFVSSERALAAWFEPHLCLANDPIGAPALGDTEIRYFNSGVMGMNLKFCRKNDVFAKARRLSVTHQERCRNYDQTALNHVLRGCADDLPPEWNFPVEFNSLPSRTRSFGDHRLNLHFIGKTKPWLFYSSMEDFRLWRKIYGEAVGPIPSYMLRWRFWGTPVWAWLVRTWWFSTISRRDSPRRA